MFVAKPEALPTSAPSKAQTRALKLKILDAIRVHIAEHGRRNWDLLREHGEYASVIGKASGEAGRRKFFRWVDDVCQPTPADKTRPHEARSIANHALSEATDWAAESAKRLPAAPSPAYLMKAGADAARNIDYMAEVHLIYADAVRLRDESMIADPGSADGQRIKDTKSFERSIARRLEVINTVVGVMQEIWDLEQQQRFQAAIRDVIVNELASAPEIRIRVIQKLQELDNEQGITMHAQVRV